MELTVPARLRRAAERWPEATALVVRGPAGSLRVGFAELARRVAAAGATASAAPRNMSGMPAMKVCWAFGSGP